MNASEALLAMVNAMGITDELDAVLRKTMIDVLNKVQDDIKKTEAEEKPVKRRGRPRKADPQETEE